MTIVVVTRPVLVMTVEENSVTSEPPDEMVVTALELVVI